MQFAKEQGESEKWQEEKQNPAPPDSHVLYFAGLIVPDFHVSHHCQAPKWSQVEWNTERYQTSNRVGHPHECSVQSSSSVNIWMLEASLEFDTCWDISGLSHTEHSCCALIAPPERPCERIRCDSGHFCHLCLFVRPARMTAGRVRISGECATDEAYGAIESPGMFRIVCSHQGREMAFSDLADEPVHD